MTMEVLEDGTERYRTEGGLTVTRKRIETAYQDAIEPYLDGLDSRRGCVFSSNYEYPGRYTRWDTATIDPPLAITARGRAMTIEAFNARGEAVMPAILAAIDALDEVTAGPRDAKKATFTVNP
ncbi:MAG: anthranilate synthase component I, partial [Nitratireductor sp.]